MNYLNLITNIYINNLKKNKKVINYIHSRGINDKTIKRFKLGYCNNNIGFKTLSNKYDKKYLLATKLFKEKNNEIYDIFYNKITIPIIIKDNVVFITGRSYPENGKLKHLHMPGKIEYAINHDILEKSQYVVLTEGPFDCFTLDQNNISSIGLLGAYRLTRTIISDLRDKDVYIAFDNDIHSQGQNAAYKMASKLIRFRIKSKIITLPSEDNKKMDINEYFKTHNKRDFLLLMKKAKSFNKKITRKKRMKRHNIDIVSTLSKYIDLIPSGDRFKAICPFHSDSHPSLMVFPESQSYYCFGCGAGGDAINFIKKIEENRGNKMNYQETVKFYEKNHIA